MTPLIVTVLILAAGFALIGFVWIQRSASESEATPPEASEPTSPATSPSETLQGPPYDKKAVITGRPVHGCSKEAVDAVLEAARGATLTDVDGAGAVQFQFDFVPGSKAAPTPVARPEMPLVPHHRLKVKKRTAPRLNGIEVPEVTKCVTEVHVDPKGNLVDVLDTTCTPEAPVLAKLSDTSIRKWRWFPPDLGVSVRTRIVFQYKP